jgi:hypothetical protein
MPNTYDVAWSELIGLVDGLDPFSAKKFINRAYADVASEREWGFLRGRAVIQIPSAISAGTVSVTQFLDTVQFSVAAAAVLDLFGLNPSVAQCQIKITTRGGPYSITDYQPGGAATLDRAYQETTDATSAYTLLRCYITPPADFLRYISVNDPLRGWSLIFGPKWTQQTLDRIDSQRTCGGDPLALATYIYRDGQTQYEVWPHPTVGRAFLTEYRKRGVDLVSGDSIPDAIGMDLLMSRAKYRAYEFGAGKSATASKAQVFLALMREANNDYEAKLHKYKKLDKAQNPDTVVIPSDRSIWPVDAEWMQAHAGYWGGFGAGW